MSCQRVFFKKFRNLLLATSLLALAHCGGGGNSDGLNLDGGVFGPETSGTPDSFRGAGVINGAKFLFGGLSQQRC